jgi:hypothetical protein
MTQEAVITKPRTPRRWLPVLVFLATVASSSQMPLAADELTSPDLNLILQRLENVQHQDPAQSRPFEVTREYKVFRGDDKQPTSEVTAQINFVSPDMKRPLPAAPGPDGSAGRSPGADRPPWCS